MSIGTDEWDFGSATPDDGMLGWNPSTPIDYGDWSGSWLPAFDGAISSVETQISGGTGGASAPSDWNSLTSQRSMGGTVDFGAGSTQPGGVAVGVGDSSSGGNWFDAAMKWFDDDKNGLKGATTVSLAGSFIKGLFGSFATKGQEKNTKRLTDIKATEVANANDIANQKFANAGSIAQTNFGAPPQGLIYSNKLEPRQKRAGYTGVA